MHSVGCELAAQGIEWTQNALTSKAIPESLLDPWWCALQFRQVTVSSCLIGCKAQVLDSAIRCANWCMSKLFLLKDQSMYVWVFCELFERHLLLQNARKLRFCLGQHMYLGWLYLFSTLSLFLVTLRLLLQHLCFQYTSTLFTFHFILSLHQILRSLKP